MKNNMSKIIYMPDEGFDFLRKEDLELKKMYNARAVGDSVERETEYNGKKKTIIIMPFEIEGIGTKQVTLNKESQNQIAKEHVQPGETFELNEIRGDTYKLVKMNCTIRNEIKEMMVIVGKDTTIEEVNEIEKKYNDEKKQTIKAEDISF